MVAVPKHKKLASGGKQKPSVRTGDQSGPVVVSLVWDLLIHRRRLQVWNLELAHICSLHRGHNWIQGMNEVPQQVTTEVKTKILTQGKNRELNGIWRRKTLQEVED